MATVFPKSLDSIEASTARAASKDRLASVDPRQRGSRQLAEKAKGASRQKPLPRRNIARSAELWTERLVKG